MLFEPRDEVALADLEHVVVGARAFERRAVDRSGEVDLHEVARDGRPAFDRIEAGQTLLQHGQLSIDLGVCDLDRVLRHFEPGVRAEHRLGAHLHLGGKGKGLLAGEIAEVDLGH